MDCEYCHKRLVKIGKARKNGKNHLDWVSRQYHKKCWTKLQQFEQLKRKFEKS